MSETESMHGTVLSNKMYDALKFLAVIVLPAIAAAYFGVAQIWGLPNAEEVVGTITIVDTLLGALLGISTRQYKNSPDSHDGIMALTGRDEDTGMPDLKITLTTPPDELLEADVVRLKVDTPLKGSDTL